MWTGPETTERELKTAVVLVLPQFSPELTAGFALALLNEGAEADLPDMDVVAERLAELHRPEMTSGQRS